jgi:hypothetical protein
VLRISLGEQAAADLRQVSLPGFNFLPKSFSLSLTFREIAFDKSAMAKVIRDYGIDIRESRCWKALHDRFRRSAVLERLG